MFPHVVNSFALCSLMMPPSPYRAIISLMALLLLQNSCWGWERIKLDYLNRNYTGSCSNTICSHLNVFYHFNFFRKIISSIYSFKKVVTKKPKRLTVSPF